MILKTFIIDLFKKSGEVGPQPNLLKILKDKFIATNWNVFCPVFIEATMSVIISQATIHCVNVNNMIKFAANSVSMLSEHFTKDGRNGLYLISEMFILCRKYGSASDKAIRWRFCVFLNHLLKHMAEGTVLSIELCDVATLLLLDRLQDKKPEVRAQAAHALHLLQTPDDPESSIVKQFMFHMTCDSSAEVRAAVVKEIAMFNIVVDEMLNNTLLDINDNVRKEAYNRILNYPFLMLSSKQRQAILEKGYEDKNKNIKSLVKKRLLKSWLEECNNDFVLFLTELGVNNDVICEKTLNLIFETYYDSQVLDLINKYLDSDSRMIAFEELTLEKIFLWKCVAKYLTTEKKIELARNQGHVDDYYIDILLPDLVTFSNYIREYYFSSTDSNEFILIQLLDMTSTFSIDDVGAEYINKLCLDLILDDQMSIKPIESVAILLELTFKNGSDLLNYVKQILNEIQTRTIDVYPLIDKVGNKELVKYEIDYKTKKIEELLKNDPSNLQNIELLIFKLKTFKKEHKEIKIEYEEQILVDMAVKNVSKVFELVFQVQQLPIVGIELSLLTDIIQNFVFVYLECSLVKLRMGAIRSLSPYLLVNNVTAAKLHMTTLCAEIAKPLTDRHLLFKVMFELFMRYDLKTFDMNDDLDTEEEYEDEFSVENILPLLVNCIDYDLDDSSFKSAIIKGFCDLLMFKKVKSTSLLSKLLLIWFRRLSRETFNIYNHLVKFFTSYVFYIDTSSSALAKCYVPVLKEIDEHKLNEHLDINLDEVNSTLINLTRGLMYKHEQLAINSHGELACYILEYLLDEDQPYTTMLVDTLYKLEINFDNNDELVNTIGPKLLRVIKHLKNLDDKNSSKYLKKIKNKFDPVLQKKKSFMKKVNKKEVDVIKPGKDQTQVPSTSIQKQNQIPSTSSQVQTQVPLISSQELVQVPSNSSQELAQVPSISTQELAQIPSNSSQELAQVPSSSSQELAHGLFKEETIIMMESSDDDSLEGFTKLDVMKRMSEVFKKSMIAQTFDALSSDSD